MNTLARPIRIFCSYAREDKSFVNILHKYLSILIRQEQILFWSDREILPGEEWRHVIEQRLEEADIILVLISPDFIASDYCWGQELGYALARQRMGDAQVIPILLKPTSGWETTPLGTLQALPEDAKPVALWDNQEKALENIVEGIGRLLLHVEREDIDVTGYVLGLWSPFISFEGPLKHLRNPATVKDDPRRLNAVCRKVVHWLKNISSRSGGTVEEDKEQKQWKFIYEQQYCTITLQSPYCYVVGRNETLKRYLCLQRHFLSITTSSLKLLDMFIKLNQGPYEYIQWILAKSLDIATITEQIYKRAGRKPSLEWCLGPSGKLRCGSSKDVTYSIHHEERTIDIILSPQQGAEPAKIALIHYGGFVYSSDVGFYRAHELLSTRRVLSILRNELPPQRLAQVIEDSVGASAISLNLGDDWRFPPYGRFEPQILSHSYLYSI